MCQLPRTQPKSVALTEQMLAGFAEYPDTFPSADIPKLQDALESFNQARESFTDAAAMYKQAGKKQKQAFEQLKAVIANQAKSAQVDTSASPVKLGLVGLGPRRKKSPVSLPAQPHLADIEPLAEGVVRLQWRKNFNHGCGPVRSFNIESRILNGSVGDWRLINSSFDCETVLKEQPCGVKLEYRVISANHSGRSLPSNTVCVVL